MSQIEIDTLLLLLEKIRGQIELLNYTLADEIGGNTDMVQALASWRRAVHLEVIRSALREKPLLAALMNDTGNINAELLRKNINSAVDALVEAHHRAPADVAREGRL
jgi:hypothetical protein